MSTVVLVISPKVGPTFGSRRRTPKVAVAGAARCIADR